MSDHPQVQLAPPGHNDVTVRSPGYNDVTSGQRVRNGITMNDLAHDEAIGSPPGQTYVIKSRSSQSENITSDRASPDRNQHRHQDDIQVISASSLVHV